MSQTPAINDLARAGIAEEEWREIPGLPGYFVSNQGRVRGMRGWVLALRPYTSDYRRVQVALRLGLYQDRYVHELVLLAFIGPRPSDVHEVDHEDKDRANNRLSNLSWLTLAENRARRDVPKGERQHSAKLKEIQVRAVRVLCFEGRGDTEIAREYGVGRKTIADIRTGKTWGHLQ